MQERVRSEYAAVSFASTLESLAIAYVATFNGEHEKWNGYPDSTRRAIEVLNLLNIRPMRALLLAVTIKFGSEESGAAFQFAVALGHQTAVAERQQKLANLSVVAWPI